MSLLELLTEEQKERYLRTPQLLEGTWWSSILGWHHSYRVCHVGKRSVRMVNFYGGFHQIKVSFQRLLHDWDYLGRDQLISQLRVGTLYLNGNILWCISDIDDHGGFTSHRVNENYNDMGYRLGTTQRWVLMGLLRNIDHLVERPTERQIRLARLCCFNGLDTNQDRQAVYRILFPEEFVQPEQKVAEPTPGEAPPVIERVSRYNLLK